MAEAPEHVQAQQVLSAVQALNAPAASPAERKAADDFLTEFQRHPSAWEVVISLICSPSTPSDAVIFAAQSLRRKVQRQLTTVEAGFYPSLLQRLIDCIISSSRNAAAALPSLVAAMAALAVQWKDWIDPLETLCSRIPNAATMQFLKALPAESADPHYAALGAAGASASATQELLDDVRSRVLRHSGKVADVLLRALRGSDPAWAVPAPLVLDCLDAWVRFGFLHHGSQPDDAFSVGGLTRAAITDMFHLAANAMLSNVPEVFMSASSAVAGMVEHAPEDMLDSFVGPVSALPTAIKQAIDTQEVDRAGMICHTFAAYCSSNMAGFNSRTEQGEQLRRGLLDCTITASDELPDSGEPVASSSLIAWSDTAEWLLRAKESGMDFLDPGYLSWQEIQELYDRVISTIIPLMAKSSYNGGGDEDALGHTPIAATAKDTLQHCCMIMCPTAYLNVLKDISRAPASTIQWQLMEGVMFGLQAAEEEVGQCLTEENGPLTEQAAQGLLQLFSDSASIRARCAAQSPAASRLSLAILEPLSRMVSPLLVTLQEQKPSDAQGLLMSTLNLAAQCWADPKVARVASSCVVQACEGALNVDINIPDSVASGLLTAIQANQDPEVEQDLVVALAHSISTGSNAAHQQAVVSQVLQALHSALEPLSSFHRAGGRGGAHNGSAASAESAAVRALRQTSWLLQQAGTFNGQGRPAPKDEQDSDELQIAAEGSMASTVVRGFVRLWPGVCEAASRELPGPAEPEELRRLAARCATLAMQASAADFLPGLPVLANAAAAAFVLPGGESFSSALAATLQLYSSQQGSLGPVLAALSRIAALPDVVNLRCWTAGDRNPDLALAVLTLTMTAVRWCNCPGDSTVLPPFLCHGLACAVANIACHNKEVFAAALNCADALVEECKVLSTGNVELRKGMYQYSPELLVALVTGLAGPSALPRVHRSASIMCHLMEVIAADPHAQRLQLQAWLTDATNALAMDGAIGPAGAQLLQSRVGALLESALPAADSTEDGRGLLGSDIGRRMKAELRAFVDVQQSQQF